MRTFNTILIALFVVSVSQEVKGQETQTKNSLISVAQLKEVLQNNPDILLLDVRTEEEFEAGHLPGAKNIDFLSDDFQEKVKDLPKNQPVYLYCRSGNRSAKAAAILNGMGFSTTYDMDGGYLNWEK